MSCGLVRTKTRRKTEELISDIREQLFQCAAKGKGKHTVFNLWTIDDVKGDSKSSSLS